MPKLTAALTVPPLMTIRELASFGRASGGTPTPPITLATPTYYDAFDYTDGTRLVAGDPNANAGLVATNPGNLGWDALRTGTANNARFNAIVYQGFIRERTANGFGDFSAPGSYLLSPPTTQSGDQYIEFELNSPASTVASVSMKGSDQSNRLQFRCNASGAGINVSTVIGGTTTSAFGANAGVSKRLMGGISTEFRALNDAVEKLTLIYCAGRAYVRRKGVPLGLGAGYLLTDPEIANPAGTRFGVSTLDTYPKWISSIRVGPAPTVLTITENFNRWYPKVKAAAGDAITTGSAAITFTGSYFGPAPTKLQWALFDPETMAQVKDWATIAAPTIGGGTWTVSNLAVPVGLNGRKAYAIGFRPVDASDTTDPSSAVVSQGYFYVALNIALIGQSNSGGLTNSMTGTYADYPGSATYQKADPPSVVKGTYTENTGYYLSTVDQAGGKGTARLGDILSAQLNIPVCFEVLAIAATAAANLNPASGTNSAYIQTHHAFAGGAFEMLYLSQGENEFVSGGPTWLTQWVDTNLPGYLAISGQPAGTVIPIFQAWTGRHTGTTSDTLASTKATREGQDGFVAYANAQLANIIALPCHHYVGCKMLDAYHYTVVYGEGYDEAARRVALSVMKHLGASAYDGMGPIATSATVSGNSIIITYDMNGATSLTARNGEDQSASASAAALTSWEASSNDFASSVAPTSTSIAGNQVTLNFAAPPTIGDKVRNHYGFQPTITSWAFGAYADGSYIGSKPIITPLVSN